MDVRPTRGPESREVGRAAPGSDTEETLEAPALASVARTLWLDGQAPRWMAELQAAGIPSILLKGRSIASWLYDSPSERDYSDIDLLVPPELYGRAGELLGRSGFRDPVARARPREGPGNARSWHRPDGLVIDLHRSVIGVTVDPSRLWEILWEHSMLLTVADTEVRVLAEDARALHVALHAAQHGAAHDGPLRDLQHALERLPAERWDEAYALARDLGAVAAFGAGLRLHPRGATVADRLGVPYQLTPVVAMRAASAPELALGFERLAVTRGPFGKLRFVMEKLLPTSEYLRSWTPLARRGPGSMFVARLWRVVWLIGHTPGALRAWRRGRAAVAAAARTRSTGQQG